MGKIISINNQKGGVAKTTTSVNLSAELAKNKNKKVLMIDLDPQANLSYNFSITDPKTTVKELFKGKPYDIVKVHENLDIIPSSLEFIGIVHDISAKMSREAILKKAIKKHQKNYDYIIIDCPSDINLITINALTCADYVIIPVEASAFGSNGIELLIENITEIKENVNEDLAILGILITKFDSRLTLSKTILKGFEEKGWNLALFNTKIRQNTAIGNSQHAQQTIYEYEATSTGAEDYIAFVKEVLNKIEKK